MTHRCGPPCDDPVPIRICSPRHHAEPGRGLRVDRCRATTPLTREKHSRPNGAVQGTSQPLPPHPRRQNSALSIVPLGCSWKGSLWLFGARASQMGSRYCTLAKIGRCRKIAWINKKGLFGIKKALDIRRPSNGRYHFAGLNARSPDAHPISIFRFCCYYRILSAWATLASRDGNRKGFASRHDNAMRSGPHLRSKSL